MTPEGLSGTEFKCSGGEIKLPPYPGEPSYACLLYTSDAADERSSVDLGGRRIIKKKKNDKCPSEVAEDKERKKNTTIVIRDK